MNKIILRDYQTRAVEKATWAYQLDGNDLLVLATGAGKSIVVAEIAHRLDANILITQPSKEILVQNMSKLKLYVPSWEIGMYSASMNSKTIRQYTFATIGSIYTKPELFSHFDILIVDEAHAVNPKNLGSMFGKFIKSVNKLRKEANKRPMKIIGLTATPYRNMPAYHKTPNGQLFQTTTLKLINRLQEKFWKRILVNVGIGDLIRQGYLCPLEYEDRSFMTHEDMKLNRSGTEFDLDNFGSKLGSKQKQVAQCILEAQKKYKSVLVFCPSVASANHFANAIDGAEAVSAKTSADERDRIIRGFKDGRIQTVFNMGVLTTGFDHPSLDCIILLRPTRSLALYMQMLGRGVRTAPGKTHCTLIDWTSTVKQLGRIETVELRKEKFPEFQDPMWEIFSETEKGVERWHGRALYTFEIKMKTPSYYAMKSAEKAEAARKLF